MNSGPGSGSFCSGLVLRVSWTSAKSCPCPSPGLSSKKSIQYESSIKLRTSAPVWASRSSSVGTM
eukprot:scaffold2671_cov252-Pinguiococcus_pyrenoidosus.AAC.10